MSHCAPGPGIPTPLQALLLDVDGVLTDGRIYYAAQGESLKVFHSLDGHGLKLLQASGCEPIVVSGRDSAALRLRLQHLGIAHMALGDENKLPHAERLLRQLGLPWSSVAAMGDDWPDLPLLQRAAFAAAPASAHHEVLRRAHYVCRVPAGAGAVREVCDLLLQANGAYAAALATALGAKPIATSP